MSWFYKKIEKDNKKKTSVLGMQFAYKKKTKDGYNERRLFGLWKAEKKQYVTKYYIFGFCISKKIDYISIIEEKCKETVDKVFNAVKSFEMRKNETNKLLRYHFPELLDNLCCISEKNPTDKIFIDENINTELHNELVQKFYPEHNQDEVVELATKRFIFNHDKYLRNRLPSALKKRLFIVSGTLSLTNALCYIKENEGIGQYEDSIVICGAYFPKFIEDTLQIINTHDFKKILFCKATENVKEILIFNNLYQVDELVFIAYKPVVKAVETLFKKDIKKIVVLEYLPIYSFDKRSVMPLDKANVSYFFSRKYFDKIDYAHPETGLPFIYMKKDTWFYVISSIKNKLNIELNASKTEKNVLLCGTGALSAEAGKEIITKLKNHGYTVYFKPHPRLNIDYSEYGVRIISNSFPIEYYDLSAFVAIMSGVSQMLFTCCDLDNPVFFYKIPTKDQKQALLHLWESIEEEYIQPWELLLEADLSKSPEELREEFLKKQKEFLQTKPKLSESEDLKRKLSY